MALMKPTPDDLPLLLEMLEDPVARYRKEASESIGQLGPAAKKAVAALLQRLSQEDKPEVAESVIRALGAIGKDAKKAIPALAQAVRSGETPLRREAIIALSLIGPADKQASAAIAEAMVDPDEQIRQTATAIMHRMVG